MRSYFFSLFAFILLNATSLIAFSQTNESTEDESASFSFGFDAGFANKYMWRGICYNQGLVFQPDFYVSYSNFTFLTWANIGIWDINAANYNEADFVLNYSNTFFNFDIESSLNYYNYFYDTDANTAEFIVGLSYPLGDFSLFTKFSVDILQTPGAIYDELGIGYEKELTDKWTIAGSLLTGIANSSFNSYNLDVNKSAFNLVGANANLSYSPLEDFSINAHFQFNHTLDQELVPSLNANSNYFEIIFTKEF